MGPLPNSGFSRRRRSLLLGAIRSLSAAAAELIGADDAGHRGRCLEKKVDPQQQGGS
jgi:hypothetical protein